jgi:hypothetical protein
VQQQQALDRIKAAVTATRLDALQHAVAPASRGIGCAKRGGVLTLSSDPWQQAADEKLAKARSRLAERKRQSSAAQAAVTAAWARAER